MDAPAGDALMVSYDDFGRAVRAHEALRGLGLTPQRLEQRAQHDEAGPVEGNFVSGNGRPGSRIDGVVTEVPGGADVPYDLNFARQIERGANLLVVRPRDADEKARILAALWALG